MGILETTLLGLMFGTLGTTLGGIIGIVTKRESNKFLSVILSFASGLMMAVICFELIPEALKTSDIMYFISGIIFGIAIMIVCDILLEKTLGQKSALKSNTMLKTGIIVAIGLAIHNIPEGLV